MRQLQRMGIDAKTGLLAAFLAFVTSQTDMKLENGATRARNAGTVISVVVIGVVALVGVLIFGQVYDAMPGDMPEGLDSSSTAIVEGFGDAMEFVPIILLVLLASVVIAVVQRMRM